ncbi:MAG: hypothetical protein KJ063_06905 [Anaerolineae bacterium]|nr:hypothetical protein [Anaerolineae bacterium]
MKPTSALTQKQLAEFLLNTAIVRPVFIWGPPGIGKSALDRLNRAEDFPQNGPIPIITDGYCDKLHVPPDRVHAYLVPKGSRLPFSPQGEVFYFV